MTFEPENDLERSPRRATTDPASRPQFYRDFIASQIFVVNHGEPPAGGGETTLEEDTSLRIGTTERNGKPYLAIFSSLTRLQDAPRKPARYSIVVSSTPFPDPPRELLRRAGRGGVEDSFGSVEPSYRRKRFGAS